MKPSLIKILSASAISLVSVMTFSWTGVTSISDDSSYGPSPTSTSTGKAAVIWMNNSEVNVSVQAALFDGVYWHDYETISTANDNVNPSIRLDAEGNALALWEEVADTSRSITFSATSVSGEWQTPQSLSTANAVISSSLAMNESGQAYAGWINQDEDVIEVRNCLLGDSWSSIQQLGTSGGTKSEFSLRVTSTGNAVAIWVENATGKVYSSRTTDGFGSNWTTPELISNSDGNSNLSLSLNGDGKAIAAWVDNYDFSIITNILSEGSWGTPAIISSDFSYFPSTRALASGLFVTWLNLGTGKIDVRRFVSDAWDTIEEISDEGPNDIPFISGALNESSTIWSDYGTGQVNLVEYGTTGNPSSPVALSANDLNLSPKITCSAALKVAAWVHVHDFGQTIQVNVE